MDFSSLKPLISPNLGSATKITNIASSVSELQGHGSVMMKLEVTVEDQNGKEERLYLVAKQVPQTELQKELFDIQVTFRKEVLFYEKVLPLLKSFQNEEGVTDISKHFAKYYGARNNLDGTSDIVDGDGLLILEDLCVRGFGNGNSRTGFGLNEAEVVLRDLANFHGTVIALKQKKPEIFEQQIKSLATPFNFSKNTMLINLFNSLKEIIQTFPEYSHFADRATNFLEKEAPKTTREPFSTITHCDLWVNNVMTKIGVDGNIENVFVDFQIFDDRSAAADVFFFLWSSVAEEVLKHNLDHLLKHYHQSLLNRLKEFSLDNSEFSYEKFEEELCIEAEYEFGHSLMFAIFLKCFIKKSDSHEEKSTLEVSPITSEAKEFVHFMVAECAKRRWLY